MNINEGSMSHAPGARRLSWEELERSTGTSRERLRQLIAAGVIVTTGDGQLPFRSGDIHRVRAVAALEASGVAPDEIALAISAGELSFGYVDFVAQPPPFDVSHADVCADFKGVADAIVVHRARRG